MHDFIVIFLFLLFGSRVIIVLLYYIGERPDTWEPMKVDQATNNEFQVQLFDLRTGSAEYNNVLKEFHKTMTGKYNNIVKIERVQNPALYAQYIAKKKVMDKHTRGSQNERRLFHGTGMGNCAKINATNFNRSFAGQNGRSVTGVVAIANVIVTTMFIS